MHILDLKGPFPDPTTFQPCLIVTLNMPLEISAEDSTEEENALIIYRAWQKAWQEWNLQKQADPTP